MEDHQAKVYDVMDGENGEKFGYWTLKYVHLQAGTRLRLLQCDDDERDNHYRYGEERQKVIIPDSKMKYISGNLGPRS